MFSFTAQLPLSVTDTFQHMPLGKHFNLCTNGDLWHIMHRHLLHRGPNTVIFVKTKGHALEDPSFLRRFPELRQEALGNDQADKAARHARTTCFDPNVVRLSDVLAERTDKYIQLMIQVHAIIARVHAASQDLRKTPAFNMDPERRNISVGDRLLPTRPASPLGLHYAPLRAKASKKLVDTHLAETGPLMIGFAQLLSHHTFAVSPSCSGFTWLELLLLSIAASPNPASVFTSNTAAPSKKLAHLIRDFTNKARTYLKFAYTPDIVNHFHVTHLPPNRLAHYGYVNRLPHTSAHINLHEDAAQALNAAMLNLQGQLSKGQQQQQQLERDCLHIRSKKFVGYTSLRANTQIVDLSRALHAHHGQTLLESPPDCAVVVSFSCPQGHTKSSTFPSPHTTTKNVWCTTCQRGHTSSKWMCPCAKLWHHCPIHFSVQLFSSTNSEQSRETCTGSSTYACTVHACFGRPRAITVLEDLP